MKRVKTILLTSGLLLGGFTLITYTSCTKDKCESVNCNTGTCVDGKCKCPTGYEGANCQTASAKKFIGVWSATDRCPQTSRGGSDLKYTITVIQSNQDPLKVSVVGLAKTDYHLTATIDGKIMTIEPQVMTDLRSYEGTINYVNDSTLEAIFNITDSTGRLEESCVSDLIAN